MPCPCHADDGFYVCADGAVYGPCEYDACGGICKWTADCENPEGCCGASLYPEQFEEAEAEAQAP